MEPTLEDIERAKKWIRYYAIKMKYKVQGLCEEKDLIAWGIEGLYDAYSRIDRDKGYMHYIKLRTKGFMYDKVRSLFPHRFIRLERVDMGDVEFLLTDPDAKIDHSGFLTPSQWKRLRNLPFKQLIYVIGYFWLHMDMQEIGDAVGITESAVSLAIKDAMKALRGEKFTRPSDPMVAFYKIPQENREKVDSFEENCYDIMKNGGVL